MKTYRARSLLRILPTAMLVAVLAATAAHAQIKGSVKDKKGNPLEDAVIYLLPAAGKAPGVDKNKRPSAIMDQVDKQFAPRVIAVQTGSEVRFPNKDNILHHVYSFSEAKSFELPLHKDRASEPVLFDRAGDVVVGCNVHDWMIGYILVVDTPWFGTTGKKGALEIKGVPAGEYKAYAYHPDMAGDYAKTAQTIKVDTRGNAAVSFTIDVKKKGGKGRAPSPGGGFAY